MSDLEFQRELSREQMREALSLLDGGARAKTPNMRVGDLNPAEEVNPGNNQASTTVAMQDRLGAIEDPQQRRKYLNLAVGCYGLGVAAAAAVTLLSWSERGLTPPPTPGIAREQLPNQPAAKPVTSSKQEVAGLSPVGQANRGDDQAPIKDATSTASVIPYAARSPTAPAIAAGQAWGDERTSRRTKEAWWRARAVRVAAAKSRFWRRRWRARAESYSSQCLPFVCPFWRNQRVSYEPPRNASQ